MHLILIRHGQPDYTDVDARHYIGHGRDLAKLSENGRVQAEEVSRDPRLKGSELILSSPYTRALQTAAIISKNTGIGLTVETDLHEWMPDLTFTYDGPGHFEEINREMARYRGEHCEDCSYQWESLSALGERAFRAVRKYGGVRKLIVVTHGIPMRQFVYVPEIPYCGILEMEFTESSEYSGFVET